MRAYSCFHPFVARSFPTVHLEVPLGSSFQEASPLQSTSVSVVSTCVSASCGPTRVLALFATSPQRSNLTRVPMASLCSDPRFSQPHAGSLRAKACELISSHSHVQGSSRSGASLSARAPSLIERSFPLAVSTPPLLQYRSTGSRR
jgi:hypothetical protein